LSELLLSPACIGRGPMFDKRFLENIDWLFLLSFFLIMVMGFVNLWSASAAAGYPFQWKQLQWYVVGTVFMFGAMAFDYRKLASYWVHIYVLTVIMLLLVMFVGKSVSGSQRWISLGFFNLQPSEPAKLLMVIVISSFFARDEKEQYGILDLWKPTLLVIIPVALIVKQPDLGTGLLVLGVFASLVYYARLKWTSFLIILGAALASFPLLWKFMKPYQRKRVEIFLNPESDPFGAGWHILQSKIAVGSGQILGKGFMKGTQAQLNFLPEVHTDFAFSIWSEEWGFAGAFVLVGIYFFFLSRCLYIAQNAKDRFGSFLVFGITAMIFWQVLINVCMVLGLMPVVGIPLPLVSYGGSSVLTTMVGVGLIMNVWLRRSVFQRKEVNQSRLGYGHVSSGLTG